MKHLVKISAISALLLFASNGWAEENIISKRCTSDSGMSIDDIQLDTFKKNGEIRYRFMDQDIFYSVYIESADSNVIEGIATFKESRTGERRGNPFSFKFDNKINTFYELNTVAKCN